MIDTDKIRALRKAGKQPIIELSPATEIKRQKRPPGLGRPRKFPKGTPLAAHYIGRRGKGVPICLAKGCTKELRVHQRGTCSDPCKQSVITRALFLLRECAITKAELLELWGED